MKLINIVFLVSGILFIGTSCQEDLLKEDPIDKISSDYVFTTEDGLNAGVIGLYNRLREYNYPGGTGVILMNAFFRVATDLGHSRVATDWAYDPARFTPTGSLPNVFWSKGYYLIDRCNSLIANAPDIDMDQDKKDVLIAQIRAIRAEVYMDLLNIYDNIVLKTEPTTIENIETIQYTPADPNDVWALINSDLDFAISKLDWVVNPGVYGQGVARHLRGRAALWQEDWQEAADQFDAIVENGTHHLVALNEVFTGDGNNAESIYTYQFNRELGGSDDLAGGGYTAYAAWFVNRLYELSSGEIIPAVEYGGLCFGWGFPNYYLKSLYDQDNDLRLTTYYYDSTKYLVNNPDKPNYGQPLPDGSIEDNFRRYHFSLKKYYDPDKPATSDQSYKNYIHYRFAETLLYGAEAHWKLSGSDVDSKALEYINMIRERAYGNSDHNFTTFTLDDYLDEYAREMALEYGRWFMLKRLGILKERVDAHYTKGSNTGNLENVIMESHMVRLPIPQSEINLMGTFPQNPGYAE